MRPWPILLQSPRRHALAPSHHNSHWCSSQSTHVNMPLRAMQVARGVKLAEGESAEFTHLLFQPVPWSPTTRKGMPAHFEA